MKRVLIVNGPNLNLLGMRQPEIYGATRLSELNEMCRSWGEELGLEVAVFQSNHEGEIIETIQGARNEFQGIVINAGAFTHYSYAIFDALAAVAVPTVEVHISNIMEREEWRRHSVIAPAAIAQIYGKGVDGYREALELLAAG